MLRNKADYLRYVYNTSLIELNIKDYRLTCDEFISIAGLINKSSTLKSLFLIGNVVNHEKLATIVYGLQGKGSLITLNLNWNNIETIGAKHLGFILANSPTLKKLSLVDNQIKDNGVDYISNALKVNTTLQSLDLKANKITAIGAAKLADALLVNCSLTALDISTNYLGEKGQSYILKALETNSTLVSLEMSFNHITESNNKLHR